MFTNCFNFWGTSSPIPPYRASPVNPTGELLSLRPQMKIPGASLNLQCRPHNLMGGYGFFRFTKINQTHGRTLTMRYLLSLAESMKLLCCACVGSIPVWAKLAVTARYLAGRWPPTSQLFQTGVDSGWVPGRLSDDVIQVRRCDDITCSGWRHRVSTVRTRGPAAAVTWPHRNWYLCASFTLLFCRYDVRLFNK